MEQKRFILYHKQGTSARTRFLCFDKRTVLYPEPLPELSQPFDETLPEPPKEVVEAHPKMLLQELAKSFDIEPEQLELDPDYVELVDIPDRVVRVYLVRFTTIDPPFDLAQRIGGEFIDLTQARSLPDTELLLLRKGYEVIMEG